MAAAVQQPRNAEEELPERVSAPAPAASPFERRAERLRPAPFDAVAIASVAVVLLALFDGCPCGAAKAYGGPTAFARIFRGRRTAPRRALSDEYLENDLVAILPDDGQSPRLCVVKAGGTVAPLCRHADDVETDLFVDPTKSAGADDSFWTEGVSDDRVRGLYGEGFYGQRPVPSLGGGPGYGAEADEVWSIDQQQLESIEEDGVHLPLIDMGIAHGEKARGGAF